MTDPRSRIPGVDRLLAAPEIEALTVRHGRVRVVEATRAAIAVVRGRLDSDASGFDGDPGSPALYAGIAEEILEAADVPSLRRVVNATGVVLHTNLGRAPLADEAIAAMRAAATGYSNLEFDLEAGARGSRYVHCASLLTDLTGAEDALVVNNAAAALVLALNTVARRKGVAVSRGELVEIGGGFRIPEVLERAETRLVEVGSTNRTRRADYEHAIGEGGAEAILKVHRSNFRITGFTEDVAIEELASLSAASGVPVLHDLGSGLMLDPSRIDLPDEPTAARSIRAGADVVVVSGDKLLGGPQAGIVVGKKAIVSAMRANPLCRALRVDKVTLAGLEATLRLYRDPARAIESIPTLRMLSLDPAIARDRAEQLATRLGAEGVTVAVVETKGAVGGGTFPDIVLPSWGIEMDAPDGPDPLALRLRAGDPPVVGRIVDGRLRLDLRTIAPEEDDDVVRCVVDAWASTDEAS